MKIKHALSTLLFCLTCTAPSWAVQTTGVVVTIKPLHSLVSGVIGETGEAKLLVDDNASPHDFQLKPSDARALQSAKAIFYIDDSLEIFMQETLASLPASVERYGVMENADLTLFEYREGGAWDTHDHDEHHGHDHDHSHEHDHNHDDHGHDDHHAHSGYDPHVWLDPANAIQIVKYVTQQLSTLYPENRNVYKDNAREVITQLETLDAQLKASLEAIQGKPFIVFHDAYQYFERAYGLRGVGAITFAPEEAGSPKRLSEVRQKLQDTNATCVFREPQFSERLVQTVIEGTDARSATLDPLGANLERGAGLYVTLMQKLESTLVKCLQ